MGGGITFCKETCHSGRRHDLVEKGVSFTEEVTLPESRCVLVGASISNREKTSHCGWGRVLEGGGVSFQNRCVLMRMVFPCERGVSFRV